MHIWANFPRNICFSSGHGPLPKSIFDRNLSCWLGFTSKFDQNAKTLTQRQMDELYHFKNKICRFFENYGQMWKLAARKHSSPFFCCFDCEMWKIKCFLYSWNYLEGRSIGCPSFYGPISTFNILLVSR